MKDRIRIIFAKNKERDSWLVEGNGRIIDCDPEDSFYVGLYINNPKELQAGDFVELGTKQLCRFRLKK